jgi:hypothetical protein
MAQECRSTWGVIFLAAREGWCWVALVACFSTRAPMASRVSGVPARVGNTGSSGEPLPSFIQARRIATTSERNGVALDFRPD